MGLRPPCMECLPVVSFDHIQVIPHSGLYASFQVGDI